MSVAVAASLVGVDTPQAVQVVVSGMSDGDAYEVTATWSGGSWAVRAGKGTVDGTQVVLVDHGGPLGQVITYTAVTDSGTATDTITVTYDGSVLLSSLDGHTVCDFDAIEDGEPLELAVRAGVHYVAGRSRPVVHHDVAGGESGSWTLLTDATQTKPLRDLLATGAVLMLRTDGSFHDIPAWAYVAVTRASRQSLGAYRQWAVSFELVDDPSPSTVVPVATWDDFDDVYADLTWSDFDDEWADEDWDAFDREDWASRAVLDSSSS